MDKIVVTGNGPLSGQIPIAGAKNACLTLMCHAPVGRAADADQRAAPVGHPHHGALLQSLGARGVGARTGARWRCRSHDLTSHTGRLRHRAKDACLDPVLGPLLAREGRPWSPAGRLRHRRAARSTSTSRALEAMGATLELRDGYVHAEARRA
jgi:UDP-N-acetylglucosamine 1-carboxyvinyltransferase